MNDINRMSRRVMAANHVAQMIPTEHSACGTDDDAFLARFLERAGDLGYTYRTGLGDVRDDLLKVGATIMAWLDKLEEEAAR